MGRPLYNASMRILIPLFLLLAGGCGCEDATLVGTAFSRSDGTATVSGTVSVDAPEGRQIELFVSPMAGFNLGVVPDNIFDAPHTCGGSFDFEIQLLRADSYLISARVQSAKQMEGADIQYDYEGWYGGSSASDATLLVVEDGESLTDIDFTLQAL
jgi:hypothetical protein